MPVTTASECLLETQHMIKSAPIFHAFHCVSPSLSSIPFPFVFPEVTSFLGGHCAVVFQMLLCLHILRNLSFPHPQHLYCFPWEADKHTEVKARQKSPQIVLEREAPFTQYHRWLRAEISRAFVKEFEGQNFKPETWSCWDDESLTEAADTDWEVRWREGRREGECVGWELRIAQALLPWSCLSDVFAVSHN